MTTLTTIELHKEDMKFSSGHYTIFDTQHREKLHGHNFTVYAAITAEVDDNGMAFDYDIYKEKLRKLCKSLSGYFLIAGTSPYQRLEYAEDYLIVHFNGERIPVPTADTLILPLKNVTVEELATWFIQQLNTDAQEIAQFKIHHLLVKVYSAPGQSGSAEWTPEPI